MASIWEQRFADFVARVTGLRESTALELIPDLMPVLPVVNPEHADLHLARGERPVSFAFDVTSAAAQFPTWWIGNPAASGCLLTLEHMVIAVGNPQEVRWGAGLGALPGAPTSAAVDDERVRNTATPMLRVTESAAAVIQGRAILFAAGVDSKTFDLQHVIPPGGFFTVQGQLANSRLVGYVQGFDRPVGQGEARLR